MELETYVNFVGWKKEGMKVEFEGDELGPSNCMMGRLILSGMNSRQIDLMKQRLEEGYSLEVVAHKL